MDLPQTIVSFYVSKGFMAALLKHNLRCLNCGWCGTRLVGDLRYPGDESHCPKCKSATIEDERERGALETTFSICCLACLFTYFFIGWLSSIFAGLAFACYLVAKKRGYKFSNLDFHLLL